MEPTVIKPTKITIHCSATKNGERCDIKTIREWHLERGFSDVGYHLVIQPNGEAQRGRSLNAQGAHVSGGNAGNIGICLIGTNQFTIKQFDTLRREIASFIMLFSIEPWEIYCHYEFESAKKQGKTCPNMRAANLVSWYMGYTHQSIESYVL